MAGAHQNLNGSRAWPNHSPFPGWFANRRLALATVNLPTKSNVSNSTRYEDMKGDTKCQKWGGLE